MANKSKYIKTGKRRGRPLLNENLRRVPTCVRLPYWLILWLKEQDDTTTDIIEAALVKYYKAH